MKLNIRPEASMKIIREVTIAAIESDLIPKSTDARTTGENVAAFMNALFIKLTKEE